jgi:hypothetical protein
MKCHTGPRSWTGRLERPKQRKQARDVSINDMSIRILTMDHISRK